MLIWGDQVNSFSLAHAHAITLQHCTHKRLPQRPETDGLASSSSNVNRISTRATPLIGGQPLSISQPNLMLILNQTKPEPHTGVQSKKRKASPRRQPLYIHSKRTPRHMDPPNFLILSSPFPLCTGSRVLLASSRRTNTGMSATIKMQARTWTTT